ncbi:MAG: hypothetical protein QM647_13810 [Asticcacaulis sp.]|uniref:hypothetical protein n=1 Tax=Asticcacaulis sp. TaxID=1872648 RepID=UPI0039E6CF6A
METSNRDSIIAYCLAPLNLNPNSEAMRETVRRLDHALKTFQSQAGRPVAVDFSQMPSLVINEAAHGYE